MFGSTAGLSPRFRFPRASGTVEDIVTEEAAVRLPEGPALHVTPLVKQGDLVSVGAAVACLRNAPDVCLVSPISGRVARISLLPGRKLSEIVIFREPGDVAERHDLAEVSSSAGLRRLMQGAGVWPLLRRRPFGGMPPHDEVPAAIFVMALDTRPLAPDPRLALEDRAEDFSRGLDALARLTDGPVFVCQNPGPPVAELRSEGRIRIVTSGERHPQGSAGIRIHQVAPAGLDAPVWDLHAEDVAVLGEFLRTGVLPMLRRVRIDGAGLREARVVRTHPGADLRQLTKRIVLPGSHTLISGSPIDGPQAQWLAPRHRQVTVLPKPPSQARPHWLVQAITRSTGAQPVIPTAALTQALGKAVPAAAFIRALGAGDDEMLMKLGTLSLLEEDVALADYAQGGSGQLMFQLRTMLDRIQAEFAA